MHLFEEVNTIMASWNPVGVDKEVALDEYRRYIPGIIKFVRAEEKSQLKQYLESILSQEMGVDYDRENLTQSNDLNLICERLLAIKTTG